MRLSLAHSKHLEISRLGCLCPGVQNSAPLPRDSGILWSGDDMTDRVAPSRPTFSSWMSFAPVLIVLSPLVFPAAVAAQCPDPSGQGDYRTIVIVGDTQIHVSTMNNSYPGDDDYPGPPGIPREPGYLGDPDDPNDPEPYNPDYAAYTRMIDWIVANKYEENIDFVMQVGDITNLGLWMPLSAAQCEGAPVQNSCRSGRDCLDPLPRGCEYKSDSTCPTCQGARATVENEWRRFNDQWARLDPNPTGGWSGVPYAIVRGNHDNVGVDIPTDTHIQGYNHFFSEQRFEELELAYAPGGGGDRFFEHLETYSGGSQDGHAWKFRIGTRDVVVVGPSVWPEQGQRTWALDFLRDYPDTSSILLTHDLGEFAGGALWSETVGMLGAPDAPPLFMTVQGHTGDDLKFVDNVRGRDLLMTVNDWSYLDEATRSNMTLVRVYPGEVDRVEAFTYSPTLDQCSLTSANYVPLQEFDLCPDADCPVNQTPPLSRPQPPFVLE